MMVDSISEVLQYVRTPLALAALVFLLGAPLLREVLRRKSRPNDDTKAIIHYGFVLGLVLGSLAFVSSVYTAGFTREIRISGTVRDESGAGLPFVAVRIAGREGGVTDDGGNFAFTIPDSRAAECMLQTCSGRAMYLSMSPSGDAAVGGGRGQRTAGLGVDPAPLGTSAPLRGPAPAAGLYRWVSRLPRALWEPFRDPLPTGQRGRPRWRSWKPLPIA